MLVIRLLRTGKKNQPSFKIVVVEKTKSSTSGRFTEEVGFYNPLTKEKVLRADRIKYWISVGAQPLETVHNLLVSEKIIEGKKIDVHKKPKKKEGEEVPAEAVKPAETPAGEAPKAEAVQKETPQLEEKKEEAAPEAPLKEEPVATAPAEAVAEPAAPKTETPEPAVPAKEEPQPEEKKEEVTKPE